MNTSSEEIDRQRVPLGPGWRAWLRGRAEFRRKFGAELEELNRYARDLRATIMRLRGRPIRRFIAKRWGESPCNCMKRDFMRWRTNTMRS